jgi:hypothetical protein
MKLGRGARKTAFGGHRQKHAELGKLHAGQYKLLL